jgi:hypothetical protein
LYDAAGHLKGCQQLLQDSISELAAQQGRTIELKVRFGCCCCERWGSGVQQWVMVAAHDVR